MEDNLEKHRQRMGELFKPIEQQILMTDDANDLRLLSTVMFTTAKKIFINQFGDKQARYLMKIMIEQ